MDRRSVPIWLFFKRDRSAATGRRAIRKLEDRILLALADFHYEHGYKSEHYTDLLTGGIYEHKLANLMGLPRVPGGRSPADFLEASRMLAADGLVRRQKRKDDFPEFGISPTRSGLDRAEYLVRSPFGKAWHLLKEKGPEMLVTVVTSFVTTVLTLLIAWFFDLLGVKS